MRHLDLCSGIGGFALAARNVGWQTTQFVEIDPYCQKVLAKNFPGVPIHDDIKTYNGRPGEFDLITAGWPCQDISNMGTRLGLEGERSGLWYEVARIVGDVLPRVVVLENVTALLAGWMGIVLGNRAEIGYDCEWHCIPAAAAGAPHRRDRVWVIAYPNGTALRNESGRLDGATGEGATVARHNGEDRRAASGADTNGRGCEKLGVEKYRELESQSRHEPDRLRSTGRRPGPTGRDPGCQLLEGWQPQGPDNRSELWNLAGWWTTEPNVGRVANGVPNRVDRLRALGNAIVPQVAESLFRAISRGLDPSTRDRDRACNE
jgi:DNA (cytosine-5)-methyltransferase 1